MPKKNRYSIKRKYTKRRRKTKNRRNKRKNKTTKKILRGGDLKKARFNCVNRMCKYNTDGEYSTLADCILDCLPPPPPSPPPSPPDINGLKLITNFREIRPGKLYILTDGKYPNGDIVFLYLPSLRPKPDKMNKQLMQEKIDEMKSIAPAILKRQRIMGRISGYDCMLKLMENIIKNYIDGHDYDDYECLNYRMTNSLSPPLNTLCMLAQSDGSTCQGEGEGNKWFRNSLNFNKPFFEYMNEKYTIYEFESWPEEIPKPPLGLTTPSADTYDISGDWRVDWDEVNAIAADCPSGWYFDRELKQCVKTPSTPSTPSTY